MKTCPSCNTDAEESAEVCPSCGYNFPPDTGVANHTMMGFPSIVGLPNESDAVDDAPNPATQTLFGFRSTEPVIPTMPMEPLDESSEVEEFFEDDATHLIPADQLQREFQADSKLGVAAVEEHARLGGSVASAWGIAEDSEDSEDLHEPDVSTSVVSPAALFHEDPTGSAFSTQGNEPPNEFPDHGTLMGMNVADFQAAEAAKAAPEPDPRSTQFAIPAVQMGDSPFADDNPPASMGVVDDDSGEVNTDVLDSPTQMWNPESLDIPEDEPDDRKQMLQEVRDSQQSPRGETQRALPVVTEADVAADAKKTIDERMAPAFETRAPIAPKIQAPNRGPMRTVPKLKGLPDPSTLRAKLQAKLGNKGQSAPPPISNLGGPFASAGPVAAEPSLEVSSPRGIEPDYGPILGVPGKGTHMAGPGDVPAEHVEPSKVSIGQLSIQQQADIQGEPKTLDDIPISGPILESELDDDFAFADTGIASPEALAQIRGTGENSTEFPSPLRGPLGEHDTVPDLPPGAEATLANSIPETPATAPDAKFHPTTPADSGFAPAVEPTGVVGLPKGPAGPSPLQNDGVQAFVPQEVAAPAALAVDKVQLVASIASGAILFIGGAVGVLGGGLVGILAFSASILSAIVVLGLGLLPVSGSIKSVIWGLAGFLNVFIGFFVVITSVSTFAGVAVCAAGLLAIGAAAIPVLTKIGS